MTDLHRASVQVQHQASLAGKTPSTELSTPSRQFESPDPHLSMMLGSCVLFSKGIDDSDDEPALESMIYNTVAGMEVTKLGGIRIILIDDHRGQRGEDIPAVC